MKKKIDTKTWQKIKKHIKRVVKKLSTSKKIKYYYFLFNMKMNEKILKLRVVEFNKKEFDASEQTITLDLVNTDKIVTSVKFKQW